MSFWEEFYLEFSVERERANVVSFFFGIGQIIIHWYSNSPQLITESKLSKWLRGACQNDHLDIPRVVI